MLVDWEPRSEWSISSMPVPKSCQPTMIRLKASPPRPFGRGAGVSTPSLLDGTLEWVARARILLPVRNFKCTRSVQLVMISYAQNFEDVLLARVFSAQTTGFYVDVGAHDPEIFSVTK